jgi:type III secretion system YscQ/HrcQ family protein
MKTSERTIAAEGEREENFAPSDLSLDPFAVDIFGKESAASETEKAAGVSAAAVETAPAAAGLRAAASRQPKRAAWFDALPRISRREAEFSNSFLELPRILSASAAKKIEETIAYYTLRPPHQVKCAVISVAEVNLAEAVDEAAKAPHVFLTLGCREQAADGGSRALVAINGDFAASIINSVLIDDGTTVFAVRELSAIERTIIEFLGIGILGEINSLLGRNLFRLQSVATEASAPFAAAERGAEIAISLNFGTFGGALSLFASQRFLAALGGLPAEKSANKTLAQRLERFVPKLSLRALIGTTRLRAADLSYLEPDDIIIIDQPEIDWQSAAFEGNLQVYLGSGGNFRLSGNACDAGNDGGELKFKIEEISVGEGRNVPPTIIRTQMNETENNLAEETETSERAATEAAGEQTADETEDAAENPAALENVLVTLRVELGASRISLREAQNLRAGQIISLGARPTDPVRIVADAGDQPLATGELIEIEGQLGVRLTKIFI